MVRMVVELTFTFGRTKRVSTSVVFGEETGLVGIDRNATNVIGMSVSVHSHSLGLAEGGLSPNFVNLELEDTYTVFVFTI